MDGAYRSRLAARDGGLSWLPHAHSIFLVSHPLTGPGKLGRHRCGRLATMRMRDALPREPVTNNANSIAKRSLQREREQQGDTSRQMRRKKKSGCRQKSLRQGSFAQAVIARTSVVSAARNAARLDREHVLLCLPPPVLKVRFSRCRAARSLALLALPCLLSPSLIPQSARSQKQLAPVAALLLHSSIIEDHILCPLLPPSFILMHVRLPTHHARKEKYPIFIF